MRYPCVGLSRNFTQAICIYLSIYLLRQQKCKSSNWKVSTKVFHLNRITLRISSKGNNFVTKIALIWIRHWIRLYFELEERALLLYYTLISTCVLCSRSVFKYFYYVREKGEDGVKTTKIWILVNTAELTIKKHILHEMKTILALTYFILEELKLNQTFVRHTIYSLLNEYSTKTLFI